MNKIEKQTYVVCSICCFLELSEVGIRTPQTSSYDAAYAFLITTMQYLCCKYSDYIKIIPPVPRDT